MKSYVFILLLFVVVYAKEKEVTERTALVVKKCQIYREADTTSPALFGAYRGEVFRINLSKKEWLRVETPQGMGWLQRIHCRTNRNQNRNSVKDSTVSVTE